MTTPNQGKFSHSGNKVLRGMENVLGVATGRKKNTASREKGTRGASQKSETRGKSSVIV